MDCLITTQGAADKGKVKTRPTETQRVKQMDTENQKSKIKKCLRR